MNKKLGKPLGDGVLLKIETAKETKSSSGLYQIEGRGKVSEATVVAVSNGFYAQNGTFVNLEVVEGDRVMVASSDVGTEIRVDGQKYNLVRISDILIKLEE